MRYAPREDGQTLVIAVVLMTSMLLFAGAVIEGGNLMLNRRNLQGNADAAARAGAANLPDQTSTALLAATDYATMQNDEDDATVDDIDITDGNTRIRVEVRRRVHGSMLGLFGMTAPIVHADATAEVAKMGGAGSRGMLPMAFMRDGYTPMTNLVVKFDGNATGNRGPVSPDYDPPRCAATSGGADFRDLIRSDEFGGVDACAYQIGETLPTEPGNMSGPTRQGFDDRIGGNTDSFDDLFTLDPTTGRYILEDPTSPRIGVVPIIENTDGSTSWPSGAKPVRVVGYVQVYIGKTDSPPDYPAQTNNGKNVWVTPVRTILPSEFAELSTWYEGNGDEPIAIHLVD